MNTYRLGKYRVLEDGTEETYNIFATNKKCIVKQLYFTIKDCDIYSKL